MKIDVPSVRRLLKEFDFKTLFREQLGWDNYQARLDIPLDGMTYSLTAIAEKRGFQVYTCPIIPDRPTRLKLDRQITKSAHEHLVIYAAPNRTEQLWEWVRREPGKPAASRDVRFYCERTGEALIQKLAALAIGLEEEEKLTIVDVTGKVKTALDVDKITKRFYDRFKAEHAVFMKFIKGIQHDPDLQWYTSLMLNRLMFVYFIQKKGFLDGDVDYLRNRLARMRQQHGKDKFYSFYRYFLLRLFHEGLGQAAGDRKADLDKLLGKVPFLDGGFFEVHDLEEKYPDIDIPDAAFEKLFAFFDDYRWHLDERPLRDDREINPDVVGYIFEKYVNQKQMGAYYTKEDITEYISKNTVIPFLFDAAEKKCAIAFKPDSALWRQLRDDPDRYIYPAVRHGVIRSEPRPSGSGPDEDIIPLPPEIAAGVADVSKRGGWNKPAPQPFALPTETWREYVARRQRCLEIREKLRRGEVHQINDLVTLNLDIWQFARDAIVNSEGPELLRAFYHTIAGRIPMRSNEKYERGLSVLDPTCGSGAFLFAALRILETLYADCLERMRRFVDELEHSGEKHRPEKYADFKAVWDEVRKHPNERYFVLKSIIINNLFGVDIMEEAVEICKLRLFLKLVAQVETAEQIEPLPDIDFNIRAGNTLVGYVSLDEVRRSQAGTLGFGDDDIKRIEEDALIADGAYKRFRETQVRHGGAVTAKDKAELRKRLGKLDAQLDRYLAGEYGIKPEKPKEFDAWRANHQPFHWLVEFFGIMRDGGFDVIIGNPPYVEYSKVRQTYQLRGFATESAGNLYAMCSERSLQLLCATGRFGFIVQAPVISTQRMLVLRERLYADSDYLAISSYDDRPSKLFDGMNHCRLAILLARRNPATALRTVLTTRYHKWSEIERAQLFQSIAYWQAPLDTCRTYVPKIRSAAELCVLRRLQTLTATVGDLLSSSDTPHRIYYKITGVGHWFTFTTRPPRFWRGNEEGSSTRESYVCFGSRAVRDAVFCLLWSTLHYWFYQLRTNCRDFNPSDLESIPLANGLAGGFKDAAKLANALIARLEASADIAEATYRVGGTVRFERFVPRSAKDEINAIDRAFAEPYGLTAEELDFIINYDIKYRMGGSDDDGDDE
jgi:hypothetical protein